MKFLKNAYPSTQVLSPSIQYTGTCSPKYCSPYNYFTELLFYCSGHVVARVQLDQITTEAYQHCFSAIFDTMKNDYPSFEVGKSLQELVVAWSDQHMKGQWVLT